jgi:hypothetical protein
MNSRRRLQKQTVGIMALMMYSRLKVNGHSSRDRFASAFFSFVNNANGQRGLAVVVVPSVADSSERIALSLDEEPSPSMLQQLLLHPDQFGGIPYPKSLSPSSISDFKNCPQSFLFQYLFGLKQPANAALAKGTICHSALEQIFDLAPTERTLPVLQNLFRREWAQTRQTDAYRHLFQNDTSSETAWGQQALQLLQHYVQLEDPATVPRPNPVQREVWVRSNLQVDAALGVTGYTTATATTTTTTTASTTTSSTDASNETDTFLVRGIVDRLDMVQVDDYHHHHHHSDGTTASADRIVLRLIDYKTGKAPDLKYSPTMNQKIQQQAFFQLKIYALLLREQQHRRESSWSSKSSSSSSSANGTTTTTTLPLRFLRLFYLTSSQDSTTGAAAAQHWDMDLGATQLERDRVLQSVHAELGQVWMDIVQLVSQQDVMAFHGCQRAFCYCHVCRQRFVPGTVWAPTNDVPKKYDKY